MSLLLVVAGISFALNGVAMLFAPHAWFFDLIPGVPDTGPFNAHLVADIGTFYLPLGAGLLVASRDPVGHVATIAVAAGASVLHAALHVYSHAAGILSLEHVVAEIAFIYVPTAVLAAMSLALVRGAPAEP